ncbi:MAG: hypothetical protein ABR57_05955 [Acidimicrobium sp. BACL17 MAG-120924-bin0]|nr:MAG: hypothetical protein ABR57_05955 [Acidimicrobium sp. BACL17 MAG-120924-bin0]
MLKYLRICATVIMRGPKRLAMGLGISLPMMAKNPRQGWNRAICLRKLQGDQFRRRRIFGLRTTIASDWVTN